MTEVISVPIALIRRVTALACGITERELLSNRRQRHVVTPRHIALFLSREMTTQSFPVIARQFRLADHTSVMHGCARITARMRLEPELADLVGCIRESLLSPAEEL